MLFGGKFPALYVFGDSLVDSGNNNHLDTKIKSNFPPYGSDFDGAKPTGRFSNGKTIADYIDWQKSIEILKKYQPQKIAKIRNQSAKDDAMKKSIYYGLPLVPAYLGLSKEEKNNISTGINYASASCGIFPETGKKMGKCLSLSVQVDLFNETIEKNLKEKFKTQSNLSKHLAESLFMTAIGVNDYVFFYKKTINANEFAEKLLTDFLQQIQRLHKLGARKFFINNIKPLGCYPNIIAHTVPRGSCNDQLNLAIGNFNDKLKESLSHMHHKLSDTSFLYSDYFNFMLGLRGPSSNQVSSSLVNTTSPCCPSVYDGGLTTSCTPSSSSCKVPDTHIFFDPFHPTQLANFLYAIRCFQESSVCHVVRD